MYSLNRSTLVCLLAGGFALAACNDDTGATTTDASDTATDSGSDSGDGDGDPTGDGDGDPAGDGDGDPTGDGDGDPTGDGDGDPTGDGDGDPTGDGDGDPTGDGDGDPTGDGDGDGDGLCHGSCGEPGCGACPDGPAPVDRGTYSIDATELPNSYYAQFLDVEFAPEYLPDLLGEACAWKTDFVPLDWPNDPVPTLPVIGVDWCDAMAYCTWAGKHLCGEIGGAPAALNDLQNAANNEWYRACSNSGTTTYPYGLIYAGDACNTIDAGFGQRTNVGSLAECEGGFADLFDMSGNVWEWTNACDNDPMLQPNEQECRRRGGSYFSDGPTTRCGIDSVRPRETRNTSVGFRCCD
ncbi:formylglycine-generating enzyme family protein [Enhygromyxa salina]|uniref:Formylglycine-generating sulfatase enzyme n=1 Tax=Enhygromyxa salina TaxID=215803 RepID=A0A2S9Y830_9BACT|nr:SUMF1/EgtB/PvdO family nonheme iron enzyme [Enhygromyxa salina]PRQ01278.1 Formylglycine-generating sulfatase enzyme [Enhygromyxa salina]